MNAIILFVIYYRNAKGPSTGLRTFEVATSTTLGALRAFYGHLRDFDLADPRDYGWDIHMIQRKVETATPVYFRDDDLDCDSDEVAAYRTSYHWSTTVKSETANPYAEAA